MAWLVGFTTSELGDKGSLAEAQGLARVTQNMCSHPPPKGLGAPQACPGSTGSGNLQRWDPLFLDWPCNFRAELCPLCPCTTISPRRLLRGDSIFISREHLPLWNPVETHSPDWYVEGALLQPTCREVEGLSTPRPRGTQERLLGTPPPLAVLFCSSDRYLEPRRRRSANHPQ